MNHTYMHIYVYTVHVYTLTIAHMQVLSTYIVYTCEFVSIDS